MKTTFHSSFVGGHMGRSFAVPCVVMLVLTGCDPEDKPTKDTAIADVTVLDTVVDAELDSKNSEDVAAPQTGLAPSIHGTHYFRIENETFAARDLTVRLRAPDDTVAAEVTTNLFGDWFVPAGLKPGAYRVCASAPERDEACAPEPLSVPAAVSAEGVRTRQVKASTFEYVVTGPAIRGKVALADGSVCVWRFPLHGVEVDGVASVERDGKTFEARMNHQGIFVLPLPLDARGQTVTLSGACESSKATTNVKLAEGPVAADVALTNRPPRPVAIALTAEGKPARALRWGRTYKAEVRYADDTPVADVRWLVSDGETQLDGKTATWTVANELSEGETAPEAIGADIEALVSDGRGGYALLAVTFPADVPRVPVGGVTDEAGDPISGAVVTHAGKTATTDENGLYALPKGSWREDKPLRISAPGHVDRLILASSPPRRVSLPLHACEIVTFEGKAGGTLRLPSNPEGLSIDVQAGSARLPSGAPLDGGVSVCMALLAPDDGDWPFGSLSDAVIDGGSASGFAPRAGAWLDFRVAADLSQRVTFAKPVTVSTRLPAGTESTMLGALTVGAEVFHATAVTPPTDGVTRTEVSGTTALTGLTPTPMDCVRLHLDGLLHRGDFVLRYQVIEQGVSHPWQFQLVVPGVERLGPLPVNRDVQIEVVDLRTDSPNGAAVAGWTRVIRTGPDPRRNVLTGDAYPYDGCSNEIALPPEAPATGVDFLSRFVPDLGPNTEGLLLGHTVRYIDAIGIYDVRRDGIYGTLRIPRSPTGGWPATAIYRNVFDLGFVRRLLFTTFATATGPRTVFAVENGLEIGEMLADEPIPLNAVVMVGTPPTLGAEPVVAFRVVRGTGGSNLLRSVNLDGRGQKPVPYVCMSCHGGDHLGPGTPPWPEHGDIGARFLPFALDSFQFPGPIDLLAQMNLRSTWSRAFQEPGLRTMNEALLKTGIGPTARRAIHGHYGSADPGADTLPVATYDESWVPPGADDTGWGDHAELYQEVISPYCRTCHLSLDNLDFSTFDDFARRASLIEMQVCTNRVMPHAALTYDKFWTTSNPHAPALLNRSMSGVPGWSGGQCP